MQKREIYGWARRPKRWAQVIRGPDTSLHQRIAEGSSPCLPRGAGMSYGDASLGPEVLELDQARSVEFSLEASTVRVDAGTSMEELCQQALLRGRFPAVLPGTRRATVGGCVAADVHGKNHLASGSFGDQVLAFDLITASGETVRCSRSENVDLFSATIGGMGWTGFISAAVLNLVPVPGPWWRSEVQRGRDLEELLVLLEATDPSAHVVGWIDPLARGSSLGRGFIERGEPSSGPERLGPARRSERGLEPPISLLGPRRMRGLNELIFARAGWLSARGPRLVSHSRFHWPFERVPNWNHLYGPRGFVQLHFVVPRSESRVLGGAIELAQRRVGGAFTGILKRFGDKSCGLLSFPMEGLGLALDLPAHADVEALAREIHHTVAEAGGRVYLAKDALLDPESFRAMYPRLPDLCRIKARVDPGARFRGDQAERLGLFSG